MSILNCIGISFILTLIIMCNPVLFSWALVTLNKPQEILVKKNLALKKRFDVNDPFLLSYISSFFCCLSIFKEFLDVF